MNEVRQALDSLNHAWRTRRFDALGQLFDDDIVMRGPGPQELARGKGAVVQSYIGFMSKSDVKDYQKSNHFVHSWDHTAIRSSFYFVLYSNFQI